VEDLPPRHAAAGDLAEGRGTDVLTSTRLVPVRDGTEIDIKIYRRRTGCEGEAAALMFRMHDGGWATGGHDMEEAENLWLAASHDVVLVSVDYRQAPKWPFPTGVQDCFDVLRWVWSQH
jgi:acetyl esterase/lipase